MIVYSIDGLILDVIDWSETQGQVVAKWREKGKWVSINKVWNGDKVAVVNEVFKAALEQKSPTNS